jgi:hypothetical protein
MSLDELRKNCRKNCALRASRAAFVNLIRELEAALGAEEAFPVTRHALAGIQVIDQALALYAPAEPKAVSR